MKKHPIRFHRGLIALLAILLLLGTLFLPLRPAVRDADDFEIHAVSYYCKGLEKADVSEYLQLDNLSFMMQLYSMPFIPTAPGLQEMEDHYFVLKGTDRGERFTILADEEGATLYYAHSGFGYRLHNGDTLRGMIYSSCYGEENRAQLKALFNP